MFGELIKATSECVTENGYTVQMFAILTIHKLHVVNMFTKYITEVNIFNE